MSMNSLVDKQYSQNESKHWSYTFHKNQLQMDHRPKYKNTKL